MTHIVVSCVRFEALTCWCAHAHKHPGAQHATQYQARHQGNCSGCIARGQATQQTQGKAAQLMRAVKLWQCAHFATGMQTCCSCSLSTQTQAHRYQGPTDSCSMLASASVPVSTVTPPNTRSASPPVDASPKKRARPAWGPLHTRHSFNPYTTAHGWGRW